ncbi:CDP-alcohol phosphatidyltransferase family protein [Skermanella stibiiresistens]|uniref:CDP-alcohol phosphatidyltransferase family protein n=1 Tax=Skermanella stibiiresistens TaxID=913326 RepID=UPI0018DD716A|nr:CDP-alcohol phosphatidyltransferase family protein [Skermanella stibiiresistens]
MSHPSPSSLPPPGALAIVRLNCVDAVTLCGLALALAALLATVHHRLELTVGLLFLAMLCDAFDGVLARRHGTTRDFGRYLDGFADAFIYLIAPSAWFHAMGFDAPWSLAILGMFIVAGVVRLSVFNGVGNIDVTSKAGAAGQPPRLAYLGVPAFWVVFIAGGYYPLLALAGPDLAEPLLGAALLLHGALMLHNAAYWKPRHLGMMLGAVCAIASVYFWLDWRLT